MCLQFPAPGQADAKHWNIRAGQQIIIDSGANQETATIDKALYVSTRQQHDGSTLTNAASAGATQIRLVELLG